MPGTLYPLTVITKLWGRYSSFSFRIRIFFHRLFPHLCIKNNEKVPHTSYLFLQDFSLIFWSLGVYFSMKSLICCAYLLIRVWFSATPWTVAHQVPLSRGFSRQEYWSGLTYTPPGDLPNPGIEPRSPPLQADSLPSEPPGKPKNTGVGTLSLLKGIFLTQKSNQGLLHCRWILYHLSYQESPKSLISIYKMYMCLSVYILYPCVYVSAI